MRKRFLLFFSFLTLFLTSGFFLATSQISAAGTGAVCNDTNNKCTDSRDDCKCTNGQSSCRNIDRKCIRSEASKKNVGETCTNDSECKNVLHCDGSKKVCVPDSCQNSSCPSGMSCIEGTVNSRSGATKTYTCKNSSVTANAWKCTCVEPGVGGSGKNGFNCTKGTEKKHDWCKDSDQACNNEPNNKVEREDLFGDDDAYGVGCGKPTKSIITCKCNRPGVSGAGANGYKCKKGSEEKEAYCKEGKQACNNVPGETFQRPDLFDNEMASGVKCAEAATPPPPSPPCKEWDSLGRCVSVQASAGLNQFSTRPEELITQIFAIGLSLAGGLGSFLVMRAGYTILVSRGNAQQVQEGRDQLWAAIVGLVFLIFSFVFLQAIGVDILRIPGVGTPSGSNGVGTTEGASCATNGDPNTGCTGGLRCDVAQDTSDECRINGKCSGTCQR